MSACRHGGVRVLMSAPRQEPHRRAMRASPAAHLVRWGHEEVGQSSSNGSIRAQRLYRSKHGAPPSGISLLQSSGIGLRWGALSETTHLEQRYVRGRPRDFDIRRLRCAERSQGCASEASALAECAVQRAQTPTQDAN